MSSYNKTVARLNSLMNTHFRAFGIGTDEAAPPALPKSSRGWTLSSVRRLHAHRLTMVEYLGVSSYSHLAEAALEVYIVTPAELLTLNGIRRELAPILRKSGFRSYLDPHNDTARLLVKNKGRDRCRNWIAVTVMGLWVTVGHSFTSGLTHASFDLRDPGSIGQVTSAVTGLFRELRRQYC